MAAPTSQATGQRFRVERKTNAVKFWLTWSVLLLGTIAFSVFIAISFIADLNLSERVFAQTLKSHKVNSVNLDVLLHVLTVAL